MTLAFSHLVLLLCSLTTVCFAGVVFSSQSLQSPSKEFPLPRSDGAVTYDVNKSIKAGWSKQKQQLGRDGPRHGQRRQEGGASEVGPEADQAEPERATVPRETRRPQGPGGSGAGGRGRSGVLLLPFKKESTDRAAESKNSDEPDEDTEVLEKGRQAVGRVERSEDFARQTVEASEKGPEDFARQRVKRSADDSGEFADSVVDYFVSLVEKRLSQLERVSDGHHTGQKRQVAGNYGKRSGSTSKFAGLVLGKWENGQLDPKVSAIISGVTGHVWEMQENVTQSFSQDAKSTTYSSLAGTFPSVAKENVQGCSGGQGEEVPDVLSLPTLMVLHCVLEASLYGVSADLDTDKLALSLRALGDYHSTEDSGLSMWPVTSPEKGSGQRSSPVNLVNNSLLGVSVLDQLTGLTKGGEKSCVAAKSTLQNINSHKSCQSHYRVPRNKSWYSAGVSPDVMSSFLNLGLGALLKRQGETTNDTTAREIWDTNNPNIRGLLQTLKALTVVFPADVVNSGDRLAGSVSRTENQTQDNNQTSEFGSFHDVLTNATNDAAELLDKAENSTENSTGVIDYLIELLREDVEDSAKGLENSTLHASNDTGGAHAHVNQILDSVSFFTLRNYLYAVRGESRDEDIRLVPLWMDRSATDDPDDPDDPIVKVRGRYNTVDLTSTATVAHALILASTDQQLDEVNDIEIEQTISSCLRMLTWFLARPSELQSAVSSSLFPSRYLLYWALSRVAFLLEEEKQKFPVEHRSSSGARAEFLSAVRQDMTLRLLDDITDDGIGSDGMSRVYVDDVTSDGKPEVGSGERLFSSAMTMNALISAWTRHRDDGRLEFIYNTRDEIRIAVNSLANFVSGAVEEVTLDSLVMADLVKNCQMLPGRYPANVRTKSSGSGDPSTAEVNSGVRGWVSEVTYSRMLHSSSVHWRTLTTCQSAFQYWSSPSLTRAAALLALAQAANLDITDKVE